MKIVFLGIIMFIAYLSSNSVYALTPAFWQDTKHDQKLKNKQSITRLITLDEHKLNNALTFVNPNSQALELLLPLPNNQTIEVTLLPSPIMTSELAEKYDDIKVWTIQGKNDPTIKGVIDLTPLGFHAMIYMPDGNVYIIDPIDPLKHRTLKKRYISYQKIKQSQKTNKSPRQCQEKRIPFKNNTLSHQYSKLLAKTASNTNVIRNKIVYRIAIATTGEYTRYFGNKKLALSAVITTLSRINQVYLRDLNIYLQLINQTDQLIFEDPVTDPFTPNVPSFVVDQSIKLMTDVIGNENFDIGHVFGQGNSYGVAFTGSACQDNFKAGGYSSSASPSENIFAIDYVAHEVGHQLGAKHTFNAETASCGGGTRNGSSAVEPGSGSSIMSYAGICWPNNIVEHSDPMFNIISIRQIENYTRSGNGKSCGNRSNTTNNHNPEITHPTQNYIIPANTAFTLTGSATDSDSQEILTYSWEQIDTGRPADLGIDNGGNPLFRHYLPTFKTTRDFPSFAQQQNKETIAGELLPTTNRTMRFKFIVRDNHGGIADKQTNIQVITNNNQAFAITSNTPLVSAQKARIRWQTAGTELPPFNCKLVDIRLSTNQGESYDHLIAENIPNNGLALVDMPLLTLNRNARLKLQCSNTIFFTVTKSARVGNDQLNTPTPIEKEKPSPDSLPNNSDDGFSPKPEGSQNTPKKQASSLSLLWLIIISLLLVIRRNHALVLLKIQCQAIFRWQDLN